MIDNFKLLEPLLNFDNEGDCYFVQLIKRKKDNPEHPRNMNVVENLLVYSLEDYYKKKDYIVELCNNFNARAYIRVNRRNLKTMGFKTAQKALDLCLSGAFHAVKSAYWSVAGEYNSEPIKRWIVDVDDDNINSTFDDAEHFYDCIELTIETLHDECNRNSKQGVYKRLMTIPTKNGVHIITNPFNLQKFKTFLPYNINIHKDNPTILYIP